MLKSGNLEKSKIQLQNFYQVAQSKSLMHTEIQDILFHHQSMKQNDYIRDIKSIAETINSNFQQDQARINKVKRKIRYGQDVEPVESPARIDSRWVRSRWQVVSPNRPYNASALESARALSPTSAGINDQ